MSRVLVLSGGAFRGAVQLPVIERLADTYEYDYVYGVSVGSINGIMFAQKSLKTLRHLWDNLEDISDFLTNKWYCPYDGLYSMKPLREKLELYTSLDRVKIPFAAGVVSFSDGEYYNLHSKYMKTNKELHDSIEASSCMVGIMKPPMIQINGTEHIGADGGFRSIIPVPKKKSYNHVDIVTCTPIDRMKMKNKNFSNKNLMSLALRSIEIFEDEIFDKDLLEIKKAYHDEITVYAPQEYPGDSLEVNKDVIKFRYKLGEEAFKNPILFKK